MKKIESTITLNNRKYTYSLAQKSDDIIFVVCVAANISQEFLSEDVPALIIDLPNLITAEQEYAGQQDAIVRFRVTAEERTRIMQNSAKQGYATVSDYMRAVALAL